MKKIHINPETGNPGECEAVDCPFIHGDNVAEARENYAKSMAAHLMPTSKRRGATVVPLFDIMDLDLLRRMQQDRFVYTSDHPDDNELTVMCYTKITPIRGAWNNVTQQARGLILRRSKGDFSDAVVVERPWRKFYTLSQHQSGWSLGDEDQENKGAANDALTSLDFDAPAEILDKSDGSMGILYEAPDGKLALSTKGSFASGQAEMYTKMLRENSQMYSAAVELRRKNKDTTFLFEMVGPENQIVVSYDKQDLILLGGVKRDSGIYTSPHDYAQAWGDNNGLTRAEPMQATTLREALTLPPRKNREGVVVRIISDDPEKQMQIKTKQEDYLKLHRLSTFMSPSLARKTIQDDPPTVGDLIKVADSEDARDLAPVGNLLGSLNEQGVNGSNPFLKDYERTFNEASIPVAKKVKAQKEYVDALPESDFTGDYAANKKKFFMNMPKGLDREEMGYLLMFYDARSKGKTDIMNQKMASAGKNIRDRIGEKKNTDD